MHAQLDALETHARANTLNTPLIREILETVYISLEEIHVLLETSLEQQAALEVERQRYRDLFEFAPDGYLVTNARGTIREANQAARRLLHMEETSVLHGRLLLPFVLPDDHSRFLELLAQLQAGERVQAWNLRIRRRSAGIFSAAVVAQPICDEDSGAVTGIRWMLRNVTEQVKQEQALQASEAALAEANATLEQRVAERTAELHASEARLWYITENLDDVFWLAAPDEQTILYVSPSYERLYGRSCASLYADPSAYHEAIHPEDRERVFQSFAGKLDQENEVVFRIIRPDDTERWVWAHAKPIFDEMGNVIHRVGIIKDITARKEYEAEIEALAYTDQLTGLANRRGLFDVGALALEAVHTHGGALALLYLDLDRFKAVNDTWGHQTGDHLLQAAAARLRNCVRPTDTVARLGGDEFAVLLPGMDASQAYTAAQRVFDDLRAPFALIGQHITISCSIGLAVATRTGAPASFSQFLTRADRAMYHAKAAACGISVYAVEE
jgi:diguanylate cyclase (GGDEF)-like protein/PAS domain S-box-containing protein